MNCKICGTEINRKEDIHWLDDVIICTECYDRKTGDYYKTNDERSLE